MDRCGSVPSAAAWHRMAVAPCPCWPMPAAQSPHAHAGLCALPRAHCPVSSCPCWPMPAGGLRYGCRYDGAATRPEVEVNVDEIWWQYFGLRWSISNSRVTLVPCSLVHVPIPSHARPLSHILLLATCFPHLTPIPPSHPKEPHPAPSRLSPLKTILSRALVPFMPTHPLDLSQVDGCMMASGGRFDHSIQRDL